MKSKITQSTIYQSTFHPLVKDIKVIIQSKIYQSQRMFGLTDLQLIDDYLQYAEIKKLHIGCGENILSGWLNSDYQPISDDILNLDATKAFSIKNNKFDYVFSEHMIEHISYSEGLSMLKECFRVLKKDGTLRVSTPNLPFLIDLYRSDKTDLQKEYVKWAIDVHVSETDDYDDTFVINRFVRAWGHQFIYDEKTLRASLTKAGFVNITRCELNHSEKESLRKLENESRLPAGFLQMETLTLEGEKLAEL
jgi:predicted SAM-dependent methyltransferase